MSKDIVAAVLSIALGITVVYLFFALVISWTNVSRVADSCTGAYVENGEIKEKYPDNYWQLNPFTVGTTGECIKPHTEGKAHD